MIRHNSVIYYNDTHTHVSISILIIGWISLNSVWVKVWYDIRLAAV